VSHPPDTPRRLPLPHVTSEGNGNGDHDHRREKVREPDGESREDKVDRAILECDAKFFVIARDMKEMARRQDNIDTNLRLIASAVKGVSARVGLTEANAQVPPMRAPLESFSSLDSEITSSGQRYVRATPEQMQVLIDARIAFIETQKKLEGNAAPMVFVKQKVGPLALVAIITTAVNWVANNVKNPFHHGP